MCLLCIFLQSTSKTGLAHFCHTNHRPSQSTSEVNRTERAAQCCYFRCGRIWLMENTNVIKYLLTVTVKSNDVLDFDVTSVTSCLPFPSCFTATNYHWWQHKVLTGTESSRCSLDSWQKCSIKISKWKAVTTAVDSHLSKMVKRKMTDIRLDFTTKATCHYAFGQSKGSYSPVKGGGVNALRYGSTLRHLKIGWKWKKLEALFETGWKEAKDCFYLLAGNGVSLFLE